MIFLKNNRFYIFLLCLLASIAFFYRFYGLNKNVSFWSDEAYLAYFVRAIIERGRPILENNYSTGVYQWFYYWLSAFSVKIFGLSEFAIRFPSAIFGFLTILIAYFLGKELFNKKIGFITAFFFSFLKIEILWSRQARPYQCLQFFFLLGAFFLYKLVNSDKNKRNYLLCFLAVGILSSLTHGLGVFLFVWGFIYLFLTKFNRLQKKLFIFLSIFIILGIFGYFLSERIVWTLKNITQINNFYYYRIFLTHNYPWISLSAFIGFIWLGLKRKYKEFFIFLTFLAAHTIMVSLFLPQPFTRYFYIVFPFVVLLSSYFLYSLSSFLKDKVNSNLFLIFLVFLLIFSSKNKFSFLPKETYSLNEDMQEIPEVDYNKIYTFVKEKINDNPGVIFISNWFDHSIWYLGEGEIKYLLRIKDYPEHIEDPVSGAIFIDNLDSLKKIIAKEEKGLILLESWESHLPDGTGEYIRSNLKKEFELDRLYFIQPRYWPVEIYSWGIDK